MQKKSGLRWLVAITMGAMCVSLANAQQNRNGRIVILRDGGQIDGDVQIQLDSKNNTTLLDDTKITGMTAQLGGKWIGVICEPVSDVLKTHLKLNSGLVIDQVVPESPAGKAGLAAKDILISANGVNLGNNSDLVAAVNDKSNKSLEMEVLRKGKEISINVIPMDRPSQAKVAFVPSGGQFGGNFQAIIDQLQQNGNGQAMRFIGPGIHSSSKMSNMPNNLSISVTRNGNNPATIKVQKNGDSWEVTEDNLGELPEEVRPHVESMLGGGGMDISIFGAGPGGIQGMPNLDNLRMAAPFQSMKSRFDEMEKNFQQMFREMEQLRGRMGVPQDDDEADVELDDKDARFVISTRVLG